MQSLKKHGERQLFPSGPRITVGLATCGIAKGRGEVFAALQQGAAQAEISSQPLRLSGCAGLCSSEPIVTVQVPGLPLLTLGDVTAADVPALVRGLKSRQHPRG